MATNGSIREIGVIVCELGDKAFQVRLRPGMETVGDVVLRVPYALPKGLEVHAFPVADPPTDLLPTVKSTDDPIGPYDVLYIVDDGKEY
jgi:hypothetical protein